MGLFDRARDALSHAASAVSRETEVLALQTKLGNLEAEKERQLIEVGKRALELKAQRRLMDETMDVLVKRIEDIEEQMMELRGQVQDARNRAAAKPVEKKCPRCGTVLQDDQKFCGNCGAKADQQEPPPADGS